jgi:nucleoside-diphosphate kinase
MGLVNGGKLLVFIFEYIRCFNLILLGPTDSNRARQESPTSLRAIYGTDEQRNAFHGSSSPADARREINFFFPNFVVDPLPTPEETAAYLGLYVNPLLSEGLLALVKEKPENPIV